MTPQFATFIQARMSSRRFPGKVLAPFRGVPMIECVVGAARRALLDGPVVVATSDERSDDPLAHHLRAAGIDFFRGSLDDVVARFAGCLAVHPCEWIVRICADSPFLREDVVRAVAERVRTEASADLVTTTGKRTFPIGTNVEILRASSLARMLAEPTLDKDDREHLTRFMHRTPDRYRIVNVESGDPSLASINLAVDTVEDLHRLEALP